MNNLFLNLFYNKSKNSTMSNPVPQLDELIQSLFDNPTFLTKLRMFNEIDCFDLFPIKQSKSFRTDVSEKLEQSSHSRSQIDTQLIVAQIQQLLSELYTKSNKQKTQQIEICGIYKQIQQIREQIKSVSDNFDMKIEKIKSVSDNNIDIQGKYVTFSQHKNWQQQILQKLDLVVKRNFHKVQSVFADKLNTMQMTFQAKISESIKINNEAIQYQISKSKEEQRLKINAEEDKEKSCKNTQDLSQTQISKKLKSAKSLGSLFGFKR